MISIETALAFSSKFADDAEKDSTIFIKMLSEFVLNEPHAVAFLTTLLQSEPFKNPLSASLICLTIFERMKNSQEESDKLKSQIKRDNI